MILFNSCNKKDFNSYASRTPFLNVEFFLNLFRSNLKIKKKPVQKATKTTKSFFLKFLRPFIHGDKTKALQLITANHINHITANCLWTTCNYFWLFFWSGYCCFFTYKERARIMVGLEHPTFRLRGGDVTTSPPPPNIKLSSTFFV